MPRLKSFNATAFILTAAGLALIGIALIQSLQGRPASLPAGSVASGAASGQSVARASAPDVSAASNSAGTLQAIAPGA